MPSRVLIITYYWPPSGGAGVQRWLKFVKYFRKFDWEPVIYTPLNPEYPAIDNTLIDDVPLNLEIIQTPIWEPYQLYKKLTGKNSDEKVNASGFISEKANPGVIQKASLWLRGNFFIPDARKFWIKPSVKFLTEWLPSHKIDAIVSTGPPHSMHLIAMAVNEKTKIPWLADFRDPWTNIDFYKDLNLTKSSDKLHHKLELEVLTKADKVVVISNSMKSDFLEIKDREYLVITNGFDSDDTNTSTVKPDSKFSISHIGSMASSRNPVMLWEALKDLKDLIPGFNDNLVIKLVGTIDFQVLQSIDKAGLTENLDKIEYRPHNEIITLQKQSRVLLLVINDTPNAKVILPGKFFEYLVSGRPILCIGPTDGDAAKIIAETGSGYVTPYNDRRLIFDTVLNLYNQYLSDQDYITPSQVSGFSREALTKKMSEVLNDLIEKHRVE